MKNETMDSLILRGDLNGTLRGVFGRLLEELERKKPAVRVPHPQNQMRMQPDMHFHWAPEVFVQLSGFTRFRFPGEAWRLMPGETAIVPRGVPHGEKVYPWHGPFHNLVLACEKREIGPLLIYHLAGEVRPRFPGGLEYGRLSVPRLQRLWAYLDDFVEVFHSSSPRRVPAARALLQSWLLGVLSVFDEHPQLEADEPFKVSQVRQLVMTRLADSSLSVRKLAAQIRCTPDYLSHLFCESAGMTLTSFINEQRLIQAKGLLETSAMNISEVAWAVGYQDEGYFTRLFRKATGQAPREYRKQARR
ncbi:MAG: AraC family transcriptional regulator [Verrucomicrobiae bacterium]|nr:AraC family transcriptional regulator [Verrucomicrobiae bacterium]